MAVEKIKNAREAVNNLPKKLFTFILIIISVILIALIGFFGVPQYLSAKPDNVGFVEGLFQNVFSAYDSGKQEGLSAKDTTVEIASKIKEVSSLQVLAANVTFNNFLSVGKKGDEKYAALQVVRGNAVFTVDLSVAEIKNENNKEISIVIPEPKVKVSVNLNDVNSVKNKAVYKKWFFNGSTNDGYEAFINSAKQINKISVKEIDNYDSLIKLSKQSAKEQIKKLISGFSLKDKTITVDFKSVKKNEK